MLELLRERAQNVQWTYWIGSIHQHLWSIRELLVIPAAFYLHYMLFLHGLRFWQYIKDAKEMWCRLDILALRGSIKWPEKLAHGPLVFAPLKTPTESSEFGTHSVHLLCRDSNVCQLPSHVFSKLKPCSFIHYAILAEARGSSCLGEISWKQFACDCNELMMWDEAPDLQSNRNVLLYCVFHLLCTSFGKSYSLLSCCLPVDSTNTVYDFR